MNSVTASRYAAPEPVQQKPALEPNYLLDDSLAAAIEINNLIQQHQNDPCALGLAVLALRNKHKNTGNLL